VLWSAIIDIAIMLIPGYFFVAFYPTSDAAKGFEMMTTLLIAETFGLWYLSKFLSYSNKRVTKEKVEESEIGTIDDSNDDINVINKRYEIDIKKYVPRDTWRVIDHSFKMHILDEVDASYERRKILMNSGTTGVEAFYENFFKQEKKSSVKFHRDMIRAVDDFLNSMSMDVIYGAPANNDEEMKRIASLKISKEEKDKRLKERFEKSCVEGRNARQNVINTVTDIENKYLAMQRKKSVIMYSTTALKPDFPLTATVLDYFNFNLSATYHEKIKNYDEARSIIAGSIDNLDHDSIQRAVLSFDKDPISSQNAIGIVARREKSTTIMKTVATVLSVLLGLFKILEFFRLF
jgi:hypothetical protein